MKKYAAVLIFFLCLSLGVNAQISELANGIISGRVTDELTNQALPGVSVRLSNQDRGTITDSTGNYSFGGLKPGVYSIRFSRVGYKLKDV
jgi:hypothetical protein